MSLERENIAEVIHVANELQQAQDRVQELKDRLRQLVSEQSGAVNIKTLLDPGPSTGDRVVTLLNAKPTASFSFRGIFQEIGGNELYLRSLLSRLTKDKKIESRGWGKYGAVSDQKERLKAV